MRRALPCALFGLAVLALAVARADEKSSDKKGGSAKKGHDQHFLHKAVQSGLAEVNAGEAAARLAGSPAVKQFAEKMVADHTKANQELLELANTKGWTAAAEMDAHHKKMAEKLAKLSGAEFDRTYMKGQVKDHEEAVKLFKHEAKNGKDKDLKAWAEKTLPALEMHLKMARNLHKKLDGGKDRDKNGGKDR